MAGAICAFCGRGMLSADGCTVTALLLPGDREIGVAFKRIPFGDVREGWSIQDLDPDARCHDCGCTFGHLHHPCCDMERCPKCGGQLLSCECMAPPGLPDDVGAEYIAANPEEDHGVG